MIRHALSKYTAPRLDFMLVVARYEIDGAPRLDLLDSGGKLYEAAEVCMMGAGTTGAAAIPPSGAEVLTLSTPNSAPYVLAGLTPAPSRGGSYQPKAELNSAGEYPTDRPALSDLSLRGSEAAVIISGQEGAVYASPRLRAQGRLEVSDGASPTQSAAIGELTLSALDEHQATLEALVSAVSQLQRLCAVALPPALETHATAKTAEAAALTQAGDLIGAAEATAEAAEATAAAIEARALPAPHPLTPPAPPSRDIISELLKIER